MPGAVRAAQNLRSSSGPASARRNWWIPDGRLEMQNWPVGTEIRKPRYWEEAQQRRRSGLKPRLRTILEIVLFLMLRFWILGMELRVLRILFGSGIGL